ncbi:allantoinase PuuE [Rhodovibrio sodomensis]|uniref:allantoinase PuuE n=1 Tax=Rhodovibrio sodomensis TaxID=1088 RepID=UPI003F58BC1A
MAISNGDSSSEDPKIGPVGRDYPRDLIGYAGDPPDPKWPGGARIAVQVVVNYEEGGERCLLHGDGESEAFLSEIVGAASWPGARHMNMESLYEYGARSGFWRLRRLLAGRGVPVTVFGVASALVRNPQAVAAMQADGWEIASHGLKWIDHAGLSRAAERAHIRKALALHEHATGERPQGWYTGRTSAHTTELVMAETDVLYSADSYADDLPYWIDGPNGPFLMVPYTLDANDMRFATPQGFNSGDQFERYLKDSFDTLYEEGRAGAPKMLSIGLHCRLAGRPGRAAALARFLDHALAHEGVWFARRIDIARHWAETHPPAARPA